MPKQQIDKHTSKPGKDHTSTTAAPDHAESASLEGLRAAFAPEGGQQSAGDGSQQGRPGLLSQLHTVQRQKRAAHMGRVLGNATMNKFIQRQDPPAVGLRLAGGSLISDWPVAVAQVNNLYTGVSTGLAWQKHRGVDLWWEQSRAGDPPPIWQSVLIDAVGMVASATIAGYGAVLTARLVINTTGAVMRAAVAASIDIGKGAAKSASSAAVAAALRSAGSDGRLVYREGLKNTIDRATQAESNALAGQLNALASLPDGEKWPALQNLYDSLNATVDQSRDLQYGDAVEGWMSASAQQAVGFDFEIGPMSLSGLYQRGALTLLQMQSIHAYLTVSPDLSLLPQASKDLLAAALGAGWESREVRRTTAEGSLATLGMVTGPTSTTGVIELHIDAPDGGGDPRVTSAEIESSHGINEDTRSYFLNSPKPISQFAVPKLLVAGSFSVGFDEGNSSATRTGLISSSGETWLGQYGARKMGMTYDAANGEMFRTAAIAFLRNELLDKTFAQLGIRSIGR
jgi:hypothetical protein